MQVRADRLRSHWKRTFSELKSEILNPFLILKIKWNAIVFINAYIMSNDEEDYDRTGQEVVSR